MHQILMQLLVETCAE